MSDNTNDHVSVSVSLQSGGSSRETFGVDIALSHNANFPERVRYYNGIDAIAADFVAGTAEYRWAGAVFSQDPKPEQVAVGRMLASVIQRYQLSAETASDSTEYKVLAKGDSFDDASLSYSSGVGASKTSIHAGMLALLNAVTDKNYLATFPALVYADKVFTAGADDIVHVAAHGLTLGAGPFQLTTTTTLPGGSALLTDYYIIPIDAGTFYLATSLANAIANTKVNLTDAGTGVHTLSDTVSTVEPAVGIIATAAAAGNWFSLEVAKTPLMKIAPTHAPSGSAIQTDLTDLLDEDAGWYCINVLYPSTAYALAVAAWAEANERVFVVDLNETDAINTAANVGTDTLAQLLAFGYKNTMYVYHHAPNEFLSAAIVGRWLPTTPGKATVKFKTLAVVTVSKLTPSQRQHLIDRRGNAYQKVGARGCFWEGTVGSTVNNFFDVTRNLHWFEDEIRNNVFDVFTEQDIVPYTAEGIQTVLGAMELAFHTGTANGVFSPDVATVVTGPSIFDVSDADKQNRVLRNANGTGTLSGAIHKALLGVNVSF